MAMRSVILGFGLFVAACATPPLPDAPTSRLPAWDGNQIVCNQTVSFAQNATAPLPEFADDERLGLCARSMRYIELHRQYGDKTDYFGVAAISTASLAATYAPLVRRAYSSSTWDFLAGMNRELEARVLAAASRAASGSGAGWFAPGLGAAGLIRAEQAEVQQRFDAFAEENPEAYALMLDEVNNTLNPTNALLISAINRNPFFKAYEAGLARIREENGGAIDYAQLEQRVEVAGVLLALIEAVPVLP